MNHWILENSIAKWHGGSLDLSWDSAKPHLGLRVVISGCPTGASCDLFGISSDGSAFETPLPPDHLSACGTKFRAEFPATERFPVKTRMAWHVLDLDSAILALDVVVSVETPRLDVIPRVVLASRIGNAEAVTPADIATGEEPPSPYLLCRFHDTELIYVEMVHPADIQSLEISPDRASAGIVFRHTLFASPLEKGVILRARFRGLFLPRGDDDAAVAACFRHFLDASPPLER